MVTKFVAILLFWLCIGCSGQDSFPEIMPIKRKFEIPSVAKGEVALTIKSRQGNPLYMLQCHPEGYSGDVDFDYSADFECRLISLYKPNTYSTLLTENQNQSRDWESRGRFFASDLRGGCEKVPQFGAVRGFRLRGMNLTLRISNPAFADDKLKSANLTVVVHPDKTATSPIAERVPVPTAVPSGCRLKEHFP